MRKKNKKIKKGRRIELLITSQGEMWSIYEVIRINNKKKINRFLFVKDILINVKTSQEIPERAICFFKKKL